MENLFLAARALGLGACMTSWASYGGEKILREAIGIPDDWLLAGHIVLGWPRGNHGPVRRRPLGDVVDLDRWDEPAVALAGERTPGTDFDVLRFRGVEQQIRGETKYGRLVALHDQPERLNVAAEHAPDDRLFLAHVRYTSDRGESSRFLISVAPSILFS